MEHLTFLSLNCQRAYHPDFKNFIEKILHSEKYDFILLQEMTAPVISMIIECTKAYKILNPYDEELGNPTEVGILYKEKFILKDSTLLSFAKIDKKRFPHGWGFVVGTFMSNDNKYTVGSVHLHSGLSRGLRMKELKSIKQNIINTDGPVLFGGDFNAGLPRELAVSKRILLPEFIRVSKKVGPTLNSRYTEKAPFILNKISVFLARFGVGFTFRTDHFYVGITMLKNNDVSCRLLPDRVSDHNPIELITMPRV